MDRTVAKKRVRAESKGAVGAAIAFSLLVAGGLVWMETMGKGNAYIASASRWERWFEPATHEPEAVEDALLPLWARLAKGRGEIVGEPQWVAEDRVIVDGHQVQLAGVQAARRARTCVRDQQIDACDMSAFDVLQYVSQPDGLIACHVFPRSVDGYALGNCHADGRSLSVALLRYGLGKAVEDEMQGASVHESFARKDGLGIWR